MRIKGAEHQLFVIALQRHGAIPAHRVHVHHAPHHAPAIRPAIDQIPKVNKERRNAQALRILANEIMQFGELRILAVHIPDCVIDGIAHSGLARLSVSQAKKPRPAQIRAKLIPRKRVNGSP